MMYLRMNLNSKRHKLGIRTTRMFPQFHDEFIHYLAKTLKQEYKDAIDKQKYIHKWAPLSISYIRYKEKHNLSVKIWKATGLLQDSIKVMRLFDCYLIGIDPKVRYKNGPKVIDIARYMEYGTNRTPARPLFTPILNNMRKNLGRYWKKFLLTKGIKI